MLNVDNLYCCDVFNGLNQIENESIDLVFADPPFNLGKDYGEDKDNRNDYIDWCNKWISECCRVLKQTGSIYIMNIQKNIWIFQKILNDNNFIFRNIIIWKNASMPVKNRYCINYQPIIFYVKTKEYTFNHKAESHYSKSVLPWNRQNKGNLMIDQWNDIPFISGGCMASKESILKKDNKSKIHPCQMPMKLAERCIKFSSNKNDIVLDPFIGIGATALACKKLNRHFIGFDTNKEYIKIAKERLMKVIKI